MLRKLVIATNPKEVAQLSATARRVSRDVEVVVLAEAHAMLELLERHIVERTALVTFSTGVIIPKSILDRFDRPSYNFHAGSPEYPGRDVHHFAHYYGAIEYGATMHKLVPKVDAGGIIDVDRFEVRQGMGPQELRQAAVKGAHRLFVRHVDAILTGVELPTSQRQWSPKTWTRKDFVEMCRIDEGIAPDELARIVSSFHVEGYRNIWTEIHGFVFRFDGLRHSS